MRDAVTAGIDWVLQRSALSDVDVILYPTDFGRDWSISAHTAGPHLVVIGVDVALLTSDALYQEVRCCLVHELHHCLRWRHVPRWTVAEAVILEGLAKRADIDAFRADVPDAVIAEVRIEAGLDDLARRGGR